MAETRNGVNRHAKVHRGEGRRRQTREGGKPKLSGASNFARGRSREATTPTCAARSKNLFFSTHYFQPDTPPPPPVPQDKCALLSSYASSSAAAPACMADLGAGRTACLHKNGNAFYKRHTNVALLVTGTGYIEQAAAALNSLLYFRSCPIHAFMVTDAAAAAALRHHAPWNGADAHPHFTWSLVQLPANPHDVTDGVSSPFRGHALLKCAMDRLLPANVDRVVVTDLDVLWTGDVCDMHDEMDVWHPSAFVGLSPEDTYYYVVPERVGTGFPIPDTSPYKLHRMDGVNSGVIAYKLARARQAGFTSAWAAHVARLGPGALGLGDQDVFNRYLTERPHLLHILPNQWNHQLNYGGNCGSRLWHGVRVLHSNGPNKLKDPIFRAWWHAFAGAVGTYKNTTWEPLSDADRCCMRSALGCLAAHGRVCDYGAWSNRVLGTPFYPGRGFHSYNYYS
jgi:hypothetical protein